MAGPGNRHFANCSGILSFPMVRRKKSCGWPYTIRPIFLHQILCLFVARTSCSCNLSFMACYANINVSQSSVATYARCGGIANMHLNANLLRNIPVKKDL